MFGWNPVASTSTSSGCSRPSAVSDAAGVTRRMRFLDEVDVVAPQRPVPAVVLEDALAHRGVVGHDLLDQLGTPLELRLDVGGHQRAPLVVRLADRRRVGRLPFRVARERRPCCGRRRSTSGGSGTTCRRTGRGGTASPLRRRPCGGTAGSATPSAGPAGRSSGGRRPARSAGTICIELAPFRRRRPASRGGRCRGPSRSRGSRGREPVEPLEVGDLRPVEHPDRADQRPDLGLLAVSSSGTIPSLDVVRSRSLHTPCASSYTAASTSVPRRTCSASPYCSTIVSM